MLALVVAFGSHGDVLPMIAIGAELKRRGHEVVFGGSEPFRRAAVAAGLAFEPLGTTAEYEQASADADIWRPIRGVERLCGYAEKVIRPAYDFVARRAVTGRTIVVGSTLALGARLARDVLRTPLVTVHMAPMQFQSRYEAPRLPLLLPLDLLPAQAKWNVQLWVDDHVIDKLVTPRLNAIRAELGRPPIGRLRHWWHAPKRTLLMCPDWFAAPQPDWPEQVRQCDFPVSDRYGAAPGGLDPEVEQFLGKGDKVIGVTLGSSMPGGVRLYRAAIEASLKLGRRCLVMTSTDLRLPPDLAGRVFVTRYAPLSVVAPRCAALIHHGGVGTIARAFAHGVPQLLTPIAFDHFDNAARVKRLGCGTVMNRHLFWPRRAKAALERLIGSTEVAAACSLVAERARGDGAIEACDAIEAEFLRARDRIIEAKRARGGVRGG